jgi:hypothetical protein
MYRRSVNPIYTTTDGQSVRLSWTFTPIWGPSPDF